MADTPALIEYLDAAADELDEAHHDRRLDVADRLRVIADALDADAYTAA